MSKTFDQNTVEWKLEPQPDLDMKEWLEGSFTKIVKVNELDALCKAKDANLRVSMIIDNGTTEFGGEKTKTSYVGPHSAEKLDQFTKRYRLLK